MSLTVEMLFPEIANLHGDNANIDYLAQCRPDARVIRTGLTDTPAFVTGPVDLVYLGPLTETGQPEGDRAAPPASGPLAGLIEAGTSMLFTHNALEVLGARIRNDDMGYDVPGLGVFELESTLKMFGRYNGKVMGTAPEVGAGHPVVGYKSQFSMVVGAGIATRVPHRGQGDRARRGDGGRGRAPRNFLGTSLLGPILVNNPYLTKALLEQLDPDTEPALAHEDLALAAYEARLADFRDPRRWHPFERVAP